MHPLLSAASEIPVSVETGSLSPEDLATIDHWLVLVPESPSDAVWAALPDGGRLRDAAARRSPDSAYLLRTRLANERQTSVVAGQVGAKDDAFAQLSLGRKLVEAIRDDAAGTLAITATGFDAEAAGDIAGRVLAAALAAAFAMPAYKAKPAAPVIREVRVIGLDAAVDTQRLEAEAAGNNLARWLTTMPPNKLDATSYADICEVLAREHDWSYRRFDTKDLEKLGAGAFLAVAQGNADDSASIVRLRYRPADKEASRIQQYR